MLDGIDAIHREALRRLVRLFEEGVLEQVVTDPAIHTLMELYDLLPAASASAAAPAATRRFPTIPIRAATPPAPVRHPHWVPVLACGDDLPAGSTRPVQADDTPLLLARRGDQFYALTGRCAVDGAPLAGAPWTATRLPAPAMRAVTTTCAPGSAWVAPRARLPSGARRRRRARVRRAGHGLPAGRVGLLTMDAVPRVLVCDVGNVLHGDDGFGVVLAWRLQKRAPPRT